MLIFQARVKTCRSSAAAAGWRTFACSPRSNDARPRDTSDRLLVSPVRIKRNARRAVECARELVEQLKKERLFARGESGQRARLRFPCRFGELRKQSLAGFCQAQAVPAAVAGADGSHHQTILFQLLKHHSGRRAIETQ